LYSIKDLEAVKCSRPSFIIHYIRNIRKNAIKLYDENEVFETGKGKVLCEGGDVSIIASGIMVAELLKAADLLQDMGIDATVIDMYSIKPIMLSFLLSANSSVI